MLGELSFTADPVALDAEIAFRNLKIVGDGGDASVDVKIDLKKLSKVLVADKMKTNDVVACKHRLSPIPMASHNAVSAGFHDGQALVLHFLNDGMFMSYYIPLVALDMDE